MFTTFMYFLFPLYSSNSQQPVQNQDEEDEEEEEEDFNQEDDAAASSWLQSMGLDKQSFPSLDPRKIKLYPLQCFYLYR